MFKKIIALILSCIMCLSIVGCGDEAKEKTDNESGKIEPPKYAAQEFEITGLWIPNEISEEAFQTYKDAGFNVCSFTNHDEQPRSSENQYYLGSKRTMQVLEICKKIGLDVYIAYGNSWYIRDIEGQDYFGSTPFSKHDYYDEYKDIIKGVHIKDEPPKDKIPAIADEALIEDFKKVYPNAKYIVNLSDITWPHGLGYDNYDDLLNHYSTAVMSQFDVPYISVDCYPFWGVKDERILENYYKIAMVAKEHNAETTMILQSSTGREFKDTLSEGDLRWQAYLAIAFGADNLQYYCYSIPKDMAYNYCILNEDGTPSVLYDYVKEINAEVQSFSDVALAYNWDDSISVVGSEVQSFRVNYLRYDDLFNDKTFKDPKHYVSASGTHDLVASRFTSEKHGEAYMFVNFAEESEISNKVTATFKDCGAVAIYGGEGFTGTPKIVKLGKDGNISLELKYGEGAFIVPLV